MEQLTREEKALLSRYFSRPIGGLEVFLQCSIYIAPSTLFAAYGLYRSDLVAVALAYLVLTGMATAFIVYNGRSSKVFRSVLQKYDANLTELGHDMLAVPRDHDPREAA